MAKKIQRGSARREKPQKPQLQDVDIIFASDVDKNTKVVTSASTSRQINRIFREAMSTYDPSNQQYSAYLNDTSTPGELTLENIQTLGQNAQSNLDNIRQINEIVRQYVNTDDLIGMVVQSITNNINTEYQLSYPSFEGQRNKTRLLERVQALVEDFNEQVNLKQFICDSIQTTYLEGNFCSLLRNSDENWQIDYLPLSIIENSGYEVNGNPVLLVNINNLRDALSKTLLKSRSGDYLFFGTTEEEVQANFPDEVYQALVNRETYAVLNTDYTGMVRINNFNRRYGLTPIFRALAPTLILSDYQNADSATAKAKGKKIIHQKLRKEALGPTGDRKAFEEMSYAHSQFMQAWQNDTVVVTTGPYVESISYVEPKVEDISEEKINIYRNKVLSSLGVAFLAADRSQTASTANINLQQLLKCINQISRQTEDVIEHYYETLLDVNGIDRAFCPQIKIIDSELLEMDMRMDLSKLLYATYGCSRDTSLALLGIDVASEAVKRQKETEAGYDQVFVPYGTSFNTGGYPTDPTPPMMTEDGTPSTPDDDNEGGRPSTTEDDDKGLYDEQYNETRS